MICAGGLIGQLGLGIENSFDLSYANKVQVMVVILVAICGLVYGLGKEMKWF